MPRTPRVRIDYGPLSALPGACGKPKGKRDPEDAIGERNGIRTYTRLSDNPERRAERRERDFGTYAECIANLPCVTASPAFYLPDGLPERVARHLAEMAAIPRAERFLSDPHHVATRGAGADRRWLVPLTRERHREADGINSGRTTFERKYGLSLESVAARLWALLGPEEIADAWALRLNPEGTRAALARLAAAEVRP